MLCFVHCELCLLCAVCCVPCAVCCVSCAVCCVLLCNVWSLLSAVCSVLCSVRLLCTMRLYVVCRALCAVCCALCAVCRVLFAVRCVPCAVCCVLFARVRSRLWFRFGSRVWSRVVQCLERFWMLTSFFCNQRLCMITSFFCNERMRIHESLARKSACGADAQGSDVVLALAIANARLAAVNVRLSEKGQAHKIPAHVPLLSVLRGALDESVMHT